MLTFLRKKMKMIMIIVAVVFAASMFYGVAMTRGGGGGGERESSNTLAEINGKKLNPYRYNEVLNRIIAQFGENVGIQDLPFIQNLALQQAIDFTLVLNQAKRKVRVSNREVNMAVNNIIQQEKLGSKAELEQALKRVGLTLSKFRSMLKDDMLVQKMINKMRAGVAVTPDDLREIRASHVLVSTEAQAEELLQRIKKGENFSTLAKEYSKDPGSAKAGGDLGYFAAGAMVPVFEEAAFALKVGEVSEIVKTPYGYHLIKVVDSRVRKFEGKEKDIEKAALAEKQQRVYQAWFSEIRGKAKIKIVNPALRAHDLRFKGRIFEAIEEYKKAIARDPSDAYLHIFLGDTYNSVGKKELALLEYDEAAKLEGGQYSLCLVLGKAYSEAGKKDLALNQYKRASMLAGDNKVRHQELLKKFKELKAWEEIKQEQAEIARIEKKEKFEKELSGGD